MKNVLRLMIVSLVFISCSQETKHSYSLVNPESFNDQMKRSADFLLLDVRTPEEFNEEALDGAVNIDFHAPDFKDQLAHLDASKTCYIYCRSGNRSHKAAAMMEELKFSKVVELEGGIIAWKEKGLAVE